MKDFKSTKEVLGEKKYRLLMDTIIQEMKEVLVKDESTGKYYFSEDHMRADQTKFILKNLSKVDNLIYEHDLGDEKIWIRIDEKGGSLND